MSDEVKTVMVPRDLQQKIEEKIVEAEKNQSIELDEKSRNSISMQLLCFFVDYGYLPEFTLERTKCPAPVLGGPSERYNFS
jgi:hypothetical protein